MSNLYLLNRVHPIYHMDQTNSVVVCAPSEKEARNIAATSKECDYDDIFNNPGQVVCSDLGEAADWLADGIIITSISNG